MKWQSASHRAKCSDCIQAFKVKYKTPPPCDGGECPYGKPILWYSNHLAMEIFNKIQNQMIIAGMGEPLGLNQQAIINILDIYCIDDREERLILFDKILAIDCVRMSKKWDEIQKNKKNKKKK